MNNKNYSNIPIMLRVICLIATVFSLSSQAQENPLAGLDDYIKEKMQELQVPAVAVAVVKDDKVVFAKGFGTRTVGKNEPVDENTLFAIASNSKYFTANALAILVDEGKISWDDLLVSRLPGFQVASDLVTSHATIRDALSHRTAIATTTSAWHGWSLTRSRKDVLSVMQYMEPLQDFRTGFNYNNEMFLAAGEVIPAVTGLSWDDFIKTRIFKPLGMKNSNTSITEFGNNANVATPHAMHNGKVVAIPYRNVSNIGPAGSINSNVVEVAQWLRLQLNGGKRGDKVIVPAKTLADTRVMQNPIEDPDSINMYRAAGLSEHFLGYGLGIFMGDSAGYRIYHHSGGLDGMISNTVFVPELNLGIVALTNLSVSPAMPLTGWILDRYTGASQTDRVADTYAYNAAKEQEAKEKFAKLLNNSAKGTTPSLPLSAYAGTYHNELVGDLVVTVSGNDLAYRFGEDSKGILHHLNFDTFLNEPTAPALRTGIDDVQTTVQFYLKEDGSVEKMKMKAYFRPLVFDKTAGKKAAHK